MTTIEHALLGVNGVFASGLHRRYGWPLAAMAGLAAVSPDWDGLTLALGPTLFDRAHRVWGHNFLMCAVSGVIIGGLDYRYDIVTRLAGLVRRLVRVEIDDGLLQIRRRRTAGGYAVWIVVALVATLSHLAADLVVSGTATLGDWELQLLWPFSTQSWIYPHVPWGDPGITIVFVIGMLALYRYPRRSQFIAGLTLLGVAGYIILRGAMRA